MSMTVDSELLFASVLWSQHIMAEIISTLFLLPLMMLLVWFSPAIC